MQRLSRTIVCAVAVVGLAVPSKLSASAEAQPRVPSAQKTTQFLIFIFEILPLFGPHLHLEIRKGDYPINPALFLWGPNKGKISKMKIKNWVHDPDVVHLADLYN